MSLEAFIVDKINKLRIKRGWSVYRLSQETGIYAQTIHDWFDHGAVPKVQYIAQVCQAFGITLADFFAEGNLVEVTPEVKALYDEWRALTPAEQSSIAAIIRNYQNNRAKNILL